MTDITLDTITALNNAYPKTQYVDYSGFIDAFQPVLNDPSMYVPQQGLLQNTPTLADITLDPTIDAYSPLVTGLLQSYPQMEQDFQSTFAVDPNTYRNFETYRRLPFDKSHWENVVGGGGSGGDGLDLGGVAAAGTVASTIVGSGNNTSTGGTDTTGTNIIKTIDTGDSDTNSSTGTDTREIIKSIDTDGSTNSSTGTDTKETISNNDTLLTLDSDSDTDGSTGTDTKELTTIDNTSLLSSIEGDESQTTGNTKETSGYITKDNATNIIKTLVDTNQITAEQGIDLTNTIETTNANFGSALLTGLSAVTGSSASASNLITGAETILKGSGGVTASGVNITQPLDLSRVPAGTAGLGKSFVPTGEAGGLNLDGTIDASINLGDTGLVDAVTIGQTPVGTDYFDVFQKNGQTFYEVYDDKLGYTYATYDPVSDTMIATDDPRNWLDKQFGKVGKWLNTPLNEGLGTAGSALNDATQFTGAEAISLGGGLLSLASALDEATPSNVFGTIAGIGASGLLGGTATTTTGTSLMAANAKAAVTGASTAGAGMTTTAGTGIQGAMTASWVAPLAVALFIGEKLQAEKSNKTGFGQYDAATGETTSFGMEGDKFKQKNVDASTSIASTMGRAVSDITSSFGLTAEGDILAQTGNRDPLNITYGNQESEATTNNRLNYNTESGDIQSGDGIERWYYTGKDGFDGARLTSDLVHGTALLSLKAKANGEDSIDLANMTLPSRSADEVKNIYLSQGFDEVAADALTSAARSASPATSELLGGLLLANTTNEANYLTPTERESLIGQGFTNEQIDTMLYGTTENSVLAINELLANKEENENNEENI